MYKTGGGEQPLKILLKNSQRFVVKTIFWWVCRRENHMICYRSLFFLARFFLVSLLIGFLSRNGQAEEVWVTRAVAAPGLEQRVFFSALVGKKVSYHIYKPNIYNLEKQRSFPVIYWLHGYRSGVNGLPRLVEYFDWAMRSGKIPMALVVFPNGLTHSMWCNSKDGRIPMESVIMEELIPQVDASFRTIPTRSGRLLEGFSMGGYGAARLGFKYADKFSAISILGAGPMQEGFTVESGPRKNAEARFLTLRIVYGDDQSYFRQQSPRALAEKNADFLRKGNVRLRILVGDMDEMYPPNQSFSSHLSRLRIPHDFIILPGVGHDPLALLRAYGRENWSFYQEALAPRLSYHSR